jgi:hypothetical protein
MEQQYVIKCQTKSDINEHLPILRKYTEKCESVIECGVRDVVSSYAFACGLKGRYHSYTMIDPYKSRNVDVFLNECKKENINASFIEKSDLAVLPFHADLLFIDTWHVYGQMKRELALWSNFISKYIVLHDTTLDAENGETIREKMDAKKQSEETGISIDEIQKGIWPAVEEFIAEGVWKIEERLTNNNGLTILSRSVR